VSLALRRHSEDLGERLLEALDGQRSQLADLGSAVSSQLDGVSSQLGEISSQLGEITNVLSAGLGELIWVNRQQLSTLMAINQTLKTPTQTQAREWCIMADELRSRELLDQAMEWYKKSLEANPLDYRTYTGGALCLIELGEWDHAESLLSDSMPHAPRTQGIEVAPEEVIIRLGPSLPEDDKGILLPLDPVRPRERDEARPKMSLGSITDWRSYSMFLLSKIRRCRSDTGVAANLLSEAVEHSPDFALARYSQATCLAELDRTKAAADALEHAILIEPMFWRLCAQDRSFAAMTDVIQITQRGFVEEQKRTIGSSLTSIRQNLDAAEKLADGIAVSMKVAWLEGTPDTFARVEPLRQKHMELQNRCNEIDDYPDLLRLSVEAEGARAESSKCLQSARQELQRTDYEAEYRKATAWKNLRNWLLPAIGTIVLCTVVFGVGGCILSLSGGQGFSGGGFVFGVLLGGSIGIVGGVVVYRQGRRGTRNRENS